MDDAVGASYGDLGGQLPDASQKEAGKQWAKRLREQLERTDKPCDRCAHGERYHGPENGCHYPTAPRGEACGCEALIQPKETNDG